MKLRVTYSRPQDLVADYDGQIARGGLFVRVDPPANTELYLPVTLEVAYQGASVVVSGQVIQLLTGVGIAVGLTNQAVESLMPLLEQVRAAGDGEGAPPIHGVDEGTPTQPSPARRARRGPIADPVSRVKNASPSEKLQIALHGNKDERNIIMRDITAKKLHQYVIRNPHIQVSEVAYIAGMTTVSPDILKFIASRREWTQRPEIAAALVRNVKTPVPLAVQMVAHVSPSELRQLAKASNVKAPIQKAARQRVFSRR